MNWHGLQTAYKELSWKCTHRKCQAQWKRKENNTCLYKKHWPKIDKNEGKRKEVTILTTADFTVIIIERHGKPHVSHLGWFILKRE